MAGRKTPEAKRAEVLGYLGSSMTHAAIARRVKGVSPATVGRILREAGQTSRSARPLSRKGKPKPPPVVEPKPKKKRDPKPSKPKSEGAPEGDPLDAIDDMLGEIASLIDDANADDYLQMVAAGQRLRLQTLALRAKLKPPPAPEPADDPNYLSSAQAAVEALTTLLKNTQAEVEGWPKCKTCGKHVRPADHPQLEWSLASRWSMALIEALQ